MSLARTLLHLSIGVASSESPSDVRVIRSVRAQAKLRAVMTAPIVLITLSTLEHLGRFPSFGLHLALANAAYVVIALAIAFRGGRAAARMLAIATTVLDPVMLSCWLGLLGEYGAVFIGFFLFTILGFGFRIGIWHMGLCQISSIAVFVVVFAFGDYWKEHITIWLGFLFTLVLVPLYAAVLIRKADEARADAESESQAKSDMLARVSHELRTPLFGIVSAAELIASASAEPRTQQHTQTILTLSNELMEEINDLLDQSKYQAHALELTVAPLRLHEQADLLHATLDALASRKNLAFRILMDPRLPEYVEADAHHLSRVLINLAGNAVKFTDRGEVKVSIELISRDADRDLVRFAVQDSGPGIPKEAQARVFDPFYQVSGAQRARVGTGLGLSIANGIVRLMGGELHVDSEPGRGCVFWFEVPLRRCEPPSKEGLPPGASPRVVGKRIFIVDDNETNLLLLKALLEEDRHVVTTADSGQAALDILNRESFDLLFLDYNLGDMNGARLLQLYRFGCTQPAPAFFLTADATLAAQAQLKDAGAVGVLTKPIRLAELRQAISRIPAQEDRRDDQSAPTPPAPAVIVRRPHLKPVPVSPVDMETISSLGLLSTRPEFLAELLRGAMADIDRNCEELVRGLSAGEHGRIRDAAHALKGVCTNVGCVRMAGFATSLMSMPPAEVLEQRERLTVELRECERVTVSALDRLIEPPDSGSAEQSAPVLHTR